MFHLLLYTTIEFSEIIVRKANPLGRFYYVTHSDQIYYRR